VRFSPGGYENLGRKSGGVEGKDPWHAAAKKTGKLFCWQSPKGDNINVGGLATHQKIKKFQKHPKVKELAFFETFGQRSLPCASEFNPRATR